MTEESTRVRRDALTVPNRTSFLEKVRDFIVRTLQDTPMEDRQKHLLVLAIDEAVTSNILFSVEAGRNGFSRVAVEIADAAVRVTIEDTGQDLDSSQTEESVLHETFRKARKHEMGIFLIRQIVDEISYAFKKGFQNQLVLTKFY